MRTADLTGLPTGILETPRDEGIEELYPPQAGAVEAGLTDGESLVVTVLTVSGKTLIVELAILSSVARSGKALYIVPLQALAPEKKAESERWEKYDIDVDVSTGSYESDGERLPSRDTIVATSEKAGSLVWNGAVWMDQLTCVVANEVHLVDDRHRGSTLEVTLAKLRWLSTDLQVVALPATVGNAGVVSGWLDAELVKSDWWLIDLKMGVHYGNAVSFVGGSQREMPVGHGERQTPALVADALEDDGEDDQGFPLVLVNSRRNVESATRRVADVTERYVIGDERSSLVELAVEIRDVSDTETPNDLANAVAKDAAFHHVGLIAEHWTLVEDALRDRFVKCTCATSMLAAGVNTPSRRVIVRDWQRYDGDYGSMKPLDVLEVHQMMGRAGRPDLDPYGEAVLLAKDVDVHDELLERYVWADAEDVRSKFATESVLRTHLLAMVAPGFTHTREGLFEFLDQILHVTQTDDPERLGQATDRVLDYLGVNGLVEFEGETIQATPIGHIVLRLYLDPMSVAEIVDGLEWATDHRTEKSRAFAGETPERPTQDRSESDESGGFQRASEMVADDGDGGGGEDGAGANGDGDSDDADGTETDQTYPTPLGLYHLVCRTPDMYQLYLKSGGREIYMELCYEREPESLGRAFSEYEDMAFEGWLSALKTAKLLEDWTGEANEDRITERYGVGPDDIRGEVETSE